MERKNGNGECGGDKRDLIVSITPGGQSKSSLANKANQQEADCPPPPPPSTQLSTAPTTVIVTHPSEETMLDQQGSCGEYF